MEKIEIKDFLGIKDITIEVKKINIVIGSQASGKSVIAKLLYYFKDFIHEIFTIAINEKNQKDLDKRYRQKFKDFFPPSFWGNNQFNIKYFLGTEFIEINRKKTKSTQISGICINYSDYYQANFKKLKNIIKRERVKFSQNDAELALSLNLDFNLHILKIYLVTISDISGTTRVSFNQLYIPAGRSFFSNFRSSIFAFLSENINVDPFLIEFGRTYERVKDITVRELKKITESHQENLFKEINLINSKILCGKYIRIDGEDYIQVDSNRTINVSNSSSSQQETLPLSIILSYIAISSRSREIGGYSVYIEEPEAHIFPSAQKDMVELISIVYNAQKNSSQFFITTHSPYILTAFNNLLQAGMLALNADEEKLTEIEKLMPKSRFLHPNEVAVYSLENGYCKSIMDEETGLIDANVIDEVSNELAVQFDQLLDLEE